MSNQPAGRVRNRLLRRLPPPDYERLLPYLNAATFELNQILYEARAAD